MGAAAAPMIEVEGVSKSFGGTQALVEVDLAAGAGTVLGLLGPNGAGKTTLVRVLTTLLRADAGRVRVASCDAVDDAQRLRAAIGLAGQSAAVDEALSGRENLDLVGRLYGLGRQDRTRRADEILDRFDLAAVADRPARTYSGGMRRRLDLGATLVGRPQVLFLDEPTAGLDPRSREELWQIIEGLVAGGTTVLLTSQYLDEVDRLADSIVVIDRGTIIATGTASELKQRVGRDVLTLGLAREGDLDASAGVLAELGEGPVHIDHGRRQLRVAAGGGATTLIAAGRRLDDAGIAIDDIAVRRPSLDDVFLALTGHTAVSDHRDPAEPQGGQPPLATTSGPAAPETDVVADPRPPGLRRTGGDIAAIARRELTHLVRSPQLLAFLVMQPLFFVLGIGVVFGGAVSAALPGNYIDFLLPGAFIITAVFAGLPTAVGVAQDLQRGVTDRLRSLPMARSAPLAGRSLADLARNALVLAVMVATGVAIGFRAPAGATGTLSAIALALAFSYALTWVFATVGLAVKEPESANAAAMIPSMLLLFASSAFVPVATMPGWLQVIARHQPVTVAADAARALVMGEPAGAATIQTFAWTFGLLAVFVPLAVSRYRTASTQ